MSDGPIAIEVLDLVKRYPKSRRFRDTLLRRPKEEVEALRGVSLRVPRGHVHGLLGANGAGKTTLLKILATLVMPTAGRASLSGTDVVADAPRAREKLGFVVAEERSFYWRLSGRDNLLFFASLQDLAGKDRDRRVDEALDVVGLAERARGAYREYSSGMRQRLSIARGLLSRPEILLMDEPTRALDPPSAHWIRRFVRERLAGELGTTVLIATHDLLEAETTCDALSLVESGRIAASGTPAELKRPLGVASRTAIALLPPWDAAKALAETVAGVVAQVRGDGTLEVVAPGDASAVADLVGDLVRAGGRVCSVIPRDADLASLFERLAASGERR
jgi:ABC-2 type transport system ATP-binding protein